MALQTIMADPVSNPYESKLSTGRKRKQPVAFATSCLSLLRKKGDSNPRYPVKGIPVFETSAFSHSAILPLGTAKIAQKNKQTKSPVDRPGILFYFRSKETVPRMSREEDPTRTSKRPGSATHS